MGGEGRLQASIPAAKSVFGADVHVGQLIGAFIILVGAAFLLNSLYAQWLAMEKDLRLALTMIFFVWILNWARKNLGSPRLAIVYAIVLAYIVFFKHPSVVWWIFGILILVTFGAKFWSKITPGAPEKDKLLEILKESKPTLVITMGTGQTQQQAAYTPYPYPAAPYPYYVPPKK